MRSEAKIEEDGFSERVRSARRGFRYSAPQDEGGNASGNIVEKTVAGVTRAFEYDLANQLKVSRVCDETTRYRYDPSSFGQYGMNSEQRKSGSCLTLRDGRQRNYAGTGNAGRLVAELDGHDPVAEYDYPAKREVLVLELVRGDTAVRYHYVEFAKSRPVKRVNERSEVGNADGMVAGKSRGRGTKTRGGKSARFQQRAEAGSGVQMAQAGFNFFASPSETHDFSESPVEPWVWEDAFGAGGAPRGAKALLARGGETFSNEPHVSGGVPVIGSDRVSEDERFFVNDYLGNTLMELPGRESTEVGRAKKDTAGFAYLTSAMGAEINEGEIGEAGGGAAMARFTGKPYDEDLQAYVFPFRNYSAELARWTSADPAGFPDGPNRHFYAPVPTMGLDPVGLERIELQPRPVQWSEFDAHTLNTVSVSGNLHASAVIEGSIDPNDPEAPSISDYTISLRPNPNLFDNAITATNKTEVELLSYNVGLVNETSFDWVSGQGYTIRTITKTFRVDLEVKETNYFRGEIVGHDVHELNSESFLFIAIGEI